MESICILSISLCCEVCARETNFNGKYAAHAVVGAGARVCEKRDFVEWQPGKREVPLNIGAAAVRSCICLLLVWVMWYVRVARLLHIQITARGPPRYPGVGTCVSYTYDQINAFVYLSSPCDVGLMQFKRLAHHTPRRAQWAISARAHHSFRFESSVNFLIELRLHFIAGIH